MTNPSETKLVEELSNAALCVYLATDEAVAKQIAGTLNAASAALASLADELRLARENERHAAQQVIEWSQIAAEEKEDAERARERIKELEKPLRLVIQCERHRGDPTIFKTFSQSYVGSYCPQCEDEAALKEPL